MTTVIETELPGVLVLEPRVFRDERGYFREAYRESHFGELAHLGVPSRFRQLNHSRSARGVLRGLHYQLVQPQGKLVTVMHGEIFDVAADVRVGSPTFGRWVGVRLTGEEPRSLWIPPGFAHGFCVLSDLADVAYACTEEYLPSGEHGVRYDDPALGIEWPVTSPLLSARDRQLPFLRDADAHLPRFAAVSPTSAADPS